MEHDGELLERYRTHGDEAAFRSLVERYQNLVYATALRRTRNSALAQEVGQQVMVALARKGRGLETRACVATWLYRAAVYEANSLMKRETRRDQRHRKHQIQTEIDQSAVSGDEETWTSLEPMLDEALKALSETDRQAVLLRYFQDLTYAQTADRLGSTEEAIRKRVTRSVDKMMVFFRRRGVLTTASALAVLIPMKASVGAPAGFAAAALKGAMATKPAWYAAFSWGSVAATAKANVGLLALAAVAGPVSAWQWQANRQLQGENAVLQQRLTALSGTVSAKARETKTTGALLAARPEATTARAKERPGRDPWRDQFRAMHRMDLEQRLNSTVAALRDRLGLTEPQQATVRTALASAHERDEERKRGPKEDALANTRAKAGVLADRDSAILGALTAAQHAGYDAFRTEERKNEVEIKATQQLMDLQSSFSPTEEQKDLAFQVFAEFAVKESAEQLAKAASNEELRGWTESLAGAKRAAMEEILSAEQFRGWSERQDRKTQFGGGRGPQPPTPTGQSQ